MHDVVQQRELLRKLRGHLAYRTHVPPYNVFKDEQLEELLEKQPKTIEELVQIKGFPREGKRVAGYGQAIIDIFNRPEKVEEFEVTVDASGDPVAKTILKKLDLF